MTSFTVSIKLTTNGRTATFRYNPPGSFVCLHCNRADEATVIPQDEAGDDYGADLCREACLDFFNLAPHLMASWPLLNPLDRKNVWREIRREQMLQAIALANRVGTERTSLESVRASLVDAVVL